MSCVFCHSEETEDVSICSNCVQKLLAMDIEELKRAYKLALTKWPAKAEALLKFYGPIIEAKEGQSLVRRKRKSAGIKQCINRRRGREVLRRNKRTIKHLEERERLAFHQVE